MDRRCVYETIHVTVILKQLAFYVASRIDARSKTPNDMHIYMGDGTVSIMASSLKNI